MRRVEELSKTKKKYPRQTQTDFFNINKINNVRVYHFLPGCTNVDVLRTTGSRYTSCLLNYGQNVQKGTAKKETQQTF